MFRTVLTSLLAVLVLCGSAFAAEKTLIAAANPTWPPMEFLDENKNIIGYDRDIIAAIAEEIGMKSEFRNIAWDGIFASLESGQANVIASCVTITDKRKEAVDFSEPYFLAHQLILTSSNLQIKSLKDLEGKLIAVVNASAGDVAASNAFGKASTNIRRFDNTPLALEELANGGVDAMIGDVGVLQWYMKQNPDKKFNQCRDPEFQEQYFGIGVRKGNTQVLNDVNAGLKKVIESGAYNEVYRKWFGSDAPKLPAFTK